MEDLILSLNENLANLKEAIQKRCEVSVARAAAEYNYRSALGRAMANGKANGIAATALYEYCRGYEHIAKLREYRDAYVAQEDYLTEMIFYYRTEIRIAEGQLKAERQGL